MKKWYKKAIISSLVIGASISIAIPLTIFNLNKKNSLVVDSENNSSNNGNNNVDKITKGNDLTPSVSNFINGKLVSKSGPIVFWGDTIMSLDWFGSVRWKLDLTRPDNKDFMANVGGEQLHIFPKKGSSNDKNTTKDYGSDIKRSWVNWNLDKNNDILWILSNIRVPRNGGNWNNSHGGYQNKSDDWKRQWLVGINVKDGSFYAKARTARIQGNNDVYRNVSVLANGDPTVYGTSFSINNQHNDNFGFERFNVSDNKNSQSEITMQRINSPSTSNLFPERVQEGKDVSDFMFNIIPIAKNINLVLSVEKSPMRSPSAGETDSPWTDKANGNKPNFGDPNQRTMDVYATLVDDDLNILNKKEEDGWNKPKKIIDNTNNNIRNKWIMPQRDWYKLLDGRFVTIIYDYVIVINPLEDSTNPIISTRKIDGIKNEWIESWSFDTNESLYIKGHSSPEIKKINLDPNKNGTNHVVSNYFNLSNVYNDKVKNAANSISIYNVPGYAGQVMGINSYQHEKYSDDLPTITENSNDNNYGLSVAIIQNESGYYGDLRGLLNTDEAFQKSADFDIKNESLANKLPSEITRDDLEITNKGFLTENKDINDNGELLYPPIIKRNVEDKNDKSLEITVHVDQIPWFVSNGKMPDDIKPTKMTKTYGKDNFKTDINQRFTWKNIETDYDFKNTLPSKLDISYINKLNPLIVNLQSQKAIINSISYPKVTYEKTLPNDSSGTITITAKYEYLPMEVKEVYSNIKTYEISQEFTMFKSTDTKQFEFAGGTHESDVTNIPELKELKESEILPSYFNNIKDKQEFLKFVDIDKTKGYPLEKIDIEAIGDDLNGTLTISVDTSKYDNTKSKNTFSKTFNGLNKTQVYKMRFKEPSENEFNKKTLLPSEISEELIYKYFLEYEGFNAKDFIINLVPNDVNGELSVYLKLNNNFPTSALEEGTDFKKQEDGSYLAFKKFNGFKTSELFNDEYQIIFKNLANLDINNDKKIINLMKLTPSYIQTELGPNGNGLTIDDETYNDVKTLSKLFIKSYGNKIPQDFTDDNVNAEMFINNSAGEITLKITFKKLDGYPNSISFVETFSGFSKGNDIPTNDVLSFYDENLFFAMHSEYKKLKPSQMKKSLEDKPSLINDFFSSEPTGDYKKAIDNKQFTLDIIDDDNNGKLILTIKFNKTAITNDKSLLEYTLEYNGFDHY